MFDEILSHDKLIILGDFNIDLLGNSSLKNSYTNIISANNFTTLNNVCVSNATRSDGVSSTIIDHVHSNLDCIFNFYLSLFQYIHMESYRKNPTKSTTKKKCFQPHFVAIELILINLSHYFF